MNDVKMTHEKTSQDVVMEEQPVAGASLEQKSGSNKIEMAKTSGEKHDPQPRKNGQITKEKN